jgi:hypothetical protein
MGMTVELCREEKFVKVDYIHIIRKKKNIDCKILGIYAI